MARALVAAALAVLALAGPVAPARAAEPLEADVRAMLLVAIPSQVLDAGTAEHLRRGGRGLLLYGSNLTRQPELRALTAAAACAAAGPLLVAVDQEAGPVARLARIGVPSPSLELDAAGMERAAWDMARRMAALGVNMNLAPVVDVAARGRGALRGRVLGGDPADVADRGAAFVAGHRMARVATVPKHFPGHGRAVVDPHWALARIDAPAGELEAIDRLPFAATIAAGAKALMVGHPIYAALDPERPASLSPDVVRMARDELGPDGVAITDGLGMEGVRLGRPAGDVAVEAVAAGQDLLIIDSAAEVEEVVEALLAAVAAGEVSRESLAESAARVRALAAWAAPVGCREEAPVAALR